MKKSNLIGIAFLIIATTLFISCNSSSEKVDKAKAEVAKANYNLDQANEEYLADMENYRIETAEKIAANQKSVADFKARIANDKSIAKDEYKAKIAALEQQNTDMKKRIDDYRETGKEKWELFKSEFSRDMDKLGKAFSDLTVKNVK